MNLGDVMDQVAEAVRAVPSLQGRSYAWPVQSMSPPCAFVRFPAGDFDGGYQRGIDRVQLNVVVVVSSVDTRGARDRYLAYADGDGEESVKVAVEGYTYTAFDSVRVESWEPSEVIINDIPYLGMNFPLDIIGSGTSS